MVVSDVRSRGSTLVPAMLMLGAVLLLAAALRFSTLAEQSFWSDEVATYGIVSHSFGHVLSAVPRSESTPHLYYVLLWLWAQIFGVSEVALRSFSAVCGTLVIVVMWALGRRLASERVGLVAGLLAAVNPFLFWYAQEARSYSLPGTPRPGMRTSGLVVRADTASPNTGTVSLCPRSASARPRTHRTRRSHLRVASGRVHRTTSWPSNSRRLAPSDRQGQPDLGVRSYPRSTCAHPDDNDRRSEQPRWHDPHTHAPSPAERR